MSGRWWAVAKSLAPLLSLSRLQHAALKPTGHTDTPCTYAHTGTRTHEQTHQTHTHAHTHTHLLCIYSLISREGILVKTLQFPQVDEYLHSVVFNLRHRAVCSKQKTGGEVI